MKLYNITIVATSVFYDGNTYYPQISLGNCLCKLAW